MKRKSNFLLRTAILTMVYALLAIGVSYTVLAVANKAYGMHANPDATTQGSAALAATAAASPSAKTAPAADVPQPTQRMKITLPAGASGVSFSFDGKYMVYLLDGKLCVENLSDASVTTLPEGVPVDHFLLMSDRNIILFFTHANGSLYVKTYTIETQVMTLQKTIKLSAGSVVKGADYSFNTNIVLINVQNLKGGSNTVISLNVMKNVKKKSTSRTVDRLVLLNNASGYYSVDENRSLCNNLKPVADLAGAPVNLLGCDLNDVVYAQSATNKNDIYKIKDNTVKGSFQIADPDFNLTYSTKSGLYLVYPDHIVNIAGDANTATPYSSDLQFLAIGGSTAYFQDRNGSVVSLPVQ